jgi:hypothetical protein
MLLLYFFAVFFAITRDIGFKLRLFWTLYPTFLLCAVFLHFGVLQCTDTPNGYDDATSVIVVNMVGIGLMLYGFAAEDDCVIVAGQLLVGSHGAFRLYIEHQRRPYTWVSPPTLYILNMYFGTDYTSEDVKEGMPLSW